MEGKANHGALIQSTRALSCVIGDQTPSAAKATLADVECADLKCAPAAHQWH